MKRAKRCLDLVSLEIGDPKTAAAGFYASSPILNGGFLSAATGCEPSASLGSNPIISTSPTRGKRVRLGTSSGAPVAAASAVMAFPPGISPRPDPFEMRFDLMSLLLDSAPVYSSSLRGVAHKQDSLDFDISLELNPFGPADLV